MLSIETDRPLAGMNTMGIDCRAAGFATLPDEAAVPALLDRLHTEWRHHPWLILGGGSNLLLLDDYPGLVIHFADRRIEILDDDGAEVLCRVAAGRDWHELVCWSVDRGLYGLENLALIPGLAGAAPMQNIGAYGREFAAVCERVDTVDLETGRRRQFTNGDCRFGYRHSIFKTPAARNWLVTAVTIRLSRKGEPVLDYPGLREEIQNGPGNTPTPAAIAAAVTRIRQRKLPDPARLGNCGSFFKNPRVAADRARELLLQFPAMPHWPGPEQTSGPQQIKLSAAWLIEQCGWKGHRRGSVGVHQHHALVLVNHGGGRGRDIWRLAGDIRDSVAGRFGIWLDPEPEIIDPQNIKERICTSNY